MATAQALRGYLLEETLAWLLRNSGYSLLTQGDKDGSELVKRRNTLHVVGRGTEHQVDALGEFPFTPAFSLPIRLFLEAKFYDKKRTCGLDIVRNAHGVISDVNQNFTYGGSSRPRRRYHYSYALFSTSGFSKNAQQFALAHQISLIDLSGESFAWLRDNIYTLASAICAASPGQDVPNRIVNWVRTMVRLGLETPREVPGDSFALIDEGLPTPADRAIHGALNDFVQGINEHGEAELLIGFPAAPFILPLHTTNRKGFLEYASRNPTHPVRIRRTADHGDAEWIITPRNDGTASYHLTFVLPQHIEDWIVGADEDGQQRRGAAVKTDFLSNITIYRMKNSALHVYQLMYESTELRRR
ncbi:hypothetical protein [Streptomyces nigra]|uniref:hypothetical protein n=1 Tax=Streptomyces nigra TaxID=1827580 RepID=UPI00365B0D87